MSTPWRLAHSLTVLLAEVNAQFPHRSKKSDGGIGNAEHASRNSDHNPYIVITEDGKKIGIVTAFDFTHDPDGGLDSEKLAEAILATKDPRIKYVISNRKIASGADGPSPWAWRRYDGKNPHNHHVHISVEDTQKLFDNREPWGLAVGAASTSNPVNTVQKLPVLSKGDNGEPVRLLQEGLNAHGATLKVDGDFGAATDRAVRLFQKTKGLEPDGRVGPYTWETLV